MPWAVKNLRIITSTSDLQPSTAIANQLPGQLVSTEISYIARHNIIGIILIIALVESTQIKIILSNCLHHMACNAGEQSL